MISALLYLQFLSLKNRLVRQFKRLRQPKYLVFAIVGGLYFYFYFFRFLFQRGGSARGWNATSAEDLAFYESVGACIFLVILLLAWIIPHERAALAFTEAEVAFLFPAPISRCGSSCCDCTTIRRRFPILGPGLRHNRRCSPLPSRCSGERGSARRCWRGGTSGCRVCGRRQATRWQYVVSTRSNDCPRTARELNVPKC